MSKRNLLAAGLLMLTTLCVVMLQSLYAETYMGRASDSEFGVSHLSGSDFLELQSFDEPLADPSDVAKGGVCLYDPPIFEDFESTPTGSIPPCWSRSGTGDWLVDGKSCSDYGLFVRLKAKSNSVAVLATPQINESLSNIRLTFKARRGDGSSQSKLQVGVVSVPTDYTTFTLYQEFEITEESYQTIFFDQYSGSLGYIAFKVESVGDENTTMVQVDDVSIELIPSCPEPHYPSSLSVGFEDALLTWEQHGSASTWDILYGEAGFDPETEGALIAGIASIPYNLEGLVPGTSYECYVRAQCGTESSGWSFPFAFITNCTPLSLPIIEDFTLTPAYEIPDCWSVARLGVANIQRNWCNTSGPANLRVDLGNNSSGYFISPLLDEDISNVMIRFKATQAPCRSLYLPIQVGTISGTDISTFTPIKSFWVDVNRYQSWAELEVYFHEYIGTNNRIALMFGGEAGSEGRIFVDDIEIDVIPATASPFYLLVNSILNNSAVLSWSNIGGVSKFDILYGEEGFDPETEGVFLTDIESSGYQLTGLVPTTTYQFYVRAYYGDEPSDWSLPFTFTTDCDPTPLTILEDFDAGIPSCWNEAGVGDYSIEINCHDNLKLYHDKYSYAMIVAPLVEESLDLLRVRFDASRGGGCTPTAHLEVGTIIDNNLSTFTPIKTFNIVKDEDNPWQRLEVYFNEYDGINNKIAFRLGDGSSKGRSNLFIDNVEIELIPACPEPHYLLVNTVTNSSAIVSWSSIGSTSKFDVIYGEYGFDPETEGNNLGEIEAHQYQFTGLDGSTQYQYYVRSYCGGVPSDWSLPIAFTTLCNPIAVPIIEDFDTIADGEIPSCWSAMGFGPKYDIEVNSGELWMRANKKSYAVLASPMLDESISNLMVSFRTKGDCNTNSARLQVGTITYNDPATFVPYRTFDVQYSSTNWSDIEVFFHGYTGADTRIAIKVGNTNMHHGSSLWIDNLVIDEIPECPNPFDVEVDEITNTSARLSWTQLGDANQWDILYWVSGQNPETEGTIIEGIGQNPYMLSDISPSTIYSFRVRSHCDELTDWSMITTFATPCGPKLAPFVEGFDGISQYETPYCWVYTGVGSYDIRAGSCITRSYDEQYLRIFTSYNSYAMAITPEIDEDIKNLRVRFMARRGNCATMGGWLHIGTVHPSDPSSFVAQESLYIDNPTWTEYTVYLNEFDGDYTHIALRLGSADDGSNANNSRMLIDNFTVEEIPFYNLTLSVSPAGAGSVTGDGPHREKFDVEVSAIANPGYSFANWTDVYTQVVSDDAQYTFAMPDEDIALTANFLKVLTIEGLIVEDKAYDGSPNATIEDVGSLVGLLDDGHEVSISAVAAVATFDSRNVAVDKEVAITDLTLTGADAHHYTLEPTIYTTATIIPKELTVINAVAQDKMYNGSPIASVDDAELSGVVPLDDVSLENSTSGTFAQVTVGVDITVATSMSISGSDAGNYTLTQPDYLSAEISQKPLEVKAWDINKTFGTTYTFTGNEFTVTGIIGTDGVTSVTLASDGAPADAVVEKYVITPSNAIGVGLDNYNISYLEGAMNVTLQKELTLPSIVASNKVYDGAIVATIDSWGELLGIELGDDVVLVTTDYSASFNNKNVDEGKAITISGLELDGDNADLYFINNQTTNADITAKSLTITGLEASDKVYDGGVSAVITGFGTLSGVCNGDADKVFVSTTAAQATFDSKNIGAGKVVAVSGLALEGVEAVNYLLESPQTTTASIMPKELSVTGSFTITSRTYNATTAAAIQNNSLELMGILGAETVAITPVAAFSNRLVGAGKIVSLTASTSLGGADAGNYTLSLLGAPTATASINPKALTVTGAVANNRPYDATSAATITGATLSGVEDSDVVTLTNFTEGIFAQATVGSAIAVTTSMSITGADASNYTLTQPTGFTANITPLVLTIGGTLTAQDKTHDGTTAATIDASELTLLTPITGDKVSLVNVVAQFEGPEVGEDKTVSISSAEIEGDDVGNYTLSLAGAPNATASIIGEAIVEPDPETFTLTLLVSPADAGTVSGAGEYEADEELTITATPAEGFQFLNWRLAGVAVSSSTTLTYTMPASDVELVAHFADTTISTFDLTLVANPAAGGFVAGSGIFTQDEEVTITATPAEGYTFVSWALGDSVVSTTPTYIFTMPDSAVTLVANFEVIPVAPTEYTLTLTIAGSGTVMVNGSAYTAPITAEEGSTFDLNAIPASGWQFDGWSGDLTSPNTDQTIGLGHNLAITATFSPISSTNMLPLADVVAYPNPFRSSITLSGAQGVERVVITNLLGARVMDIAHDGQQQLTLSTGELARGVYIINLYSTDGQRGVRRVVKE